MPATSPMSRRRGVIIGLSGVAVVATVLLLVGRSAPHAIPAMLLLVPIAVTSSLADRWAAIGVALVAAIVFAVGFLPPVGEVRIRLGEDLFVTVTFVVVALVVGSLRRPQSSAPAALLDDRRALLLRGVSHDLRNPLTTIRAISSDLLDGDQLYDDDVRHKLLGRVVDESERLDRIVGNLLSASRVQAGALNPNLERESVAHLVQGSASRIGRDGDGRIVAEIGDDVDDVAADRVQIDQVLTNLLENALRYAPVGSVVTVGAVQRGAMVEVTVRDHGPGFSATARSHLFQPFHSDQLGTTGLGLTVCKAIVEAHHGTIRVCDEPSGGASVCFSLPVHADVRVDPARRG